eukprot:CAMPEP_0202354020 /NCGR_PEP_ID=MMETSP1126-20121109/9523_1 /ASSEMBLY_ACC=CAM_ASM_000457 /TAXON_ID=3047 /ORGANISM="Dunaliella tertiolecta, Strain CCMP1320" /LENGTH=84 /DNA_ID=CAMNT_0048946435 /DNA_START=703 /DNA_END=957 /DNA_ORIENTATION=+
MTVGFPLLSAVSSGTAICSNTAIEGPGLSSRLAANAATAANAAPPAIPAPFPLLGAAAGGEGLGCGGLGGCWGVLLVSTPLPSA